jgi:hypothetical protein
VRTRVVHTPWYFSALETSPGKASAIFNSLARLCASSASP